MEENKPLKEQLRVRRAVLQHTQEQASKAIGIHSQTYFKAEKYGIMSERTKKKILKYLMVEL